METNDHVMVVDDDAEIRRLLGDYLRKNGYRATAVADGAAMWAALARGKIDLIVLDLMLPGEDGLSLCRKLRSESDTPVIMLTARGEETDRVVGLEMGADDYLAKPFSARELLARVKSVLRRYRALPMHLRADDATSIRFSGWTLDVRARHLVSADGVVTPLSGAEFQLLRVFLSHPGQVLSRDQLLEIVWGDPYGVSGDQVKLYVGYLRRKLSPGAPEAVPIDTVRGFGYRYRKT